MNTDVLIIGFGKGGKTLAGYLGKQGIETVLVEQSPTMYGGTCINIGCIPTKALVVQAERHTPYATAIAAKDALITFLRGKNYDALAGLASVRVLTGKASFAGTNQVKVSRPAGPDVLIHAQRICINTGTVPVIPGIAGLALSSRVYSSTTLMDEKALPAALVIIGGGFISLEYASMYAQYGSRVTILESMPEILPREDEDIAAEVKKVLAQKGIQVLTGAAVRAIEPGDETDLVVFEQAGRQQSVRANAILVATGRKAYTEGLDLAAAGVVTDARGFIPVNERLQTSQPHIWAVGDINGGPQFTYISLDDYRIIRDQLHGKGERKRTDRQNVPFCVFISPPFAHVGLREKEAIAQGLPVRVSRIPPGVVPRTRILGELQGMLKAIIHRETDQILGFTLFCAEAQEMINTARMAMNAGMTFTQLKDQIYTHPSMTEAFNYFD
ncbi:MAG: FAD-dependent oxidoreductase [Cytophagales bacterium]|nr:FAD-dependent oxidoreductase [Cytophagales bacterium]